MMEEKVLAYIQEHNMMTAGDTVVVGVSGGADSICLLRVLFSLRERLGICLHAIHVEHGIRGEASAADAAFTKMVCQELGVPCTIVSVDVPACAENWQMGLEEAARRCRYEVFWKEIARIGASRHSCASEDAGRVRLALAHHANDVCETVLFHMARGCDVAGLAGILPVREGGILVRPLLGVTRAEIEAYLRVCNQPYCTDETNADVTYARNRLRHEVLPALTAVNEKAVEHICDLADRMEELEDYLEIQIRQAYEACVKEMENGLAIDVEALKEYHLYLQRALLREAIANVSGTRRDLSAVHVNDVQRLLTAQTGARVDLPRQVKARRQYGQIILTGVTVGESTRGLISEGKADLSGIENPERMLCYEVTPQMLKAGRVEVQLPHGMLQFSVENAVCSQPDLWKNNFTKYFNYDNIKNSIFVRYPEEGDVLVLHPDGKKQALRRYFINAKIPRKKRSRIPVVAVGCEVLWIVGERSGEAYRIGPDTEKMLVAAFVPKEESAEDGNL